MNWTEEEYRALARKQAGGASRRLPEAKPSKYRNQKVTVDGMTFDSKKEAARWQALLVQERVGMVRGLTRQVPFALSVGVHVIGEYRADFVYDERMDQDWCTRVEDVKGGRATKTAIYQWKKRHFQAQYGLTIRET